MLEQQEGFKILSRKDKRKARQKIDHNSPIVKCVFCDLNFYNYSETYNAHLLFFHSFLMPTCSSPKNKRLVDNVLNGMQLREGKQLERKHIRINRRNGNLHLWRWKLRAFFEHPLVKIRYDIQYSKHYHLPRKLKYNTVID